MPELRKSLNSFMFLHELEKHKKKNIPRQNYENHGIPRIPIRIIKIMKI